MDGGAWQATPLLKKKVVITVHTLQSGYEASLVCFFNPSHY